MHRYRCQDADRRPAVRRSQLARAPAHPPVAAVSQLKRWQDRRLPSRCPRRSHRMHESGSFQWRRPADRTAWTNSALVFWLRPLTFSSFASCRPRLACALLAADSDYRCGARVRRSGVRPPMRRRLFTVRAAISSALPTGHPVIKVGVPDVLVLPFISGRPTRLWHVAAVHTHHKQNSCPSSIDDLLGCVCGPAWGAKRRAKPNAAESTTRQATGGARDV